MVKPQLVQEYVTSGQVLFEYHPFPFLGDESVVASEASLCANDQGKFWPYHDLLFYNQVGENEGAFARGRLNEMAQRADLDMEQFNQCMDDHTHADELQAMKESAQSRGVSSTPSFLVGDQLITRISGYADLKTAIDKALQQSQGSN